MKPSKNIKNIYFKGEDIITNIKIYLDTKKNKYH